MRWALWGLLPAAPGCFGEDCEWWEPDCDAEQEEPPPGLGGTPVEIEIAEDLSFTGDAARDGRGCYSGSYREPGTEAIAVAFTLPE